MAERRDKANGGGLKRIPTREKDEAVTSQKRKPERRKGGCRKCVPSRLIVIGRAGIENGRLLLEGGGRSGDRLNTNGDGSEAVSQSGDAGAAEQPLY